MLNELEVLASSYNHQRLVFQDRKCDLVWSLTCNHGEDSWQSSISQWRSRVGTKRCGNPQAWSQAALARCNLASPGWSQDLETTRIYIPIYFKSQLKILAASAPTAAAADRHCFCCWLQPFLRGHTKKHTYVVYVVQAEQKPNYLYLPTRPNISTSNSGGP